MEKKIRVVPGKGQKSSKDVPPAPTQKIPKPAKQPKPTSNK